MCNGILEVGCSVDQFSCGDGSCVSESNVCDGTWDCASGAEEVNCSKLQISASIYCFFCKLSVTF